MKAYMKFFRKGLAGLMIKVIKTNLKWSLIWYLLWACINVLGYTLIPSYNIPTLNISLTIGFIAFIVAWIWCVLTDKRFRNKK